jgi:hypothetical protein
MRSFDPLHINGVNEFGRDSSINGFPTVHDLQAPTTNSLPTVAIKGTPPAWKVPVEIPVKPKAILSNLSSVEVADINGSSDLVEMSIDPLMAMELIREGDADVQVHVGDGPADRPVGLPKLSRGHCWDNRGVFEWGWAARQSDRVNGNATASDVDGVNGVNGYGMNGRADK